MAKKAAKNDEKNDDRIERCEWDKFPNESMKHYQWFLWYRDSIYDTKSSDVSDTIPKLDIRKHRSYRRVAEYFGVSETCIEERGRKDNWQKRVEAYDEYIALTMRQEHDEKIKQMLNNHATLGAAMIQKAVKRFIDIRADEISVADTIKMADVGVKIERMSRGVGSEETVVQITTPQEQEKKPAADVEVMPVFDLSKLSDEELSSLDGILGKLSETDSQ